MFLQTVVRGDTRVSIPADVSGDNIVLNFNQRYVVDPLVHFSDDSIRLRFAGPGRPVVIEGVSDNTTRYLMMPMTK